MTKPSKALTAALNELVGVHYTDDDRLRPIRKTIRAAISDFDLVGPTIGKYMTVRDDTGRFDWKAD